jgi:hypothetical protein
MQSLKRPRIAPNMKQFAIAQFIISTIKLIKQSVDVIFIGESRVFCLRCFNHGELKESLAGNSKKIEGGD